MSHRPARLFAFLQRSSFSTSICKPEASSLGSRWLSDIGLRIRNCNAAQSEEARDILRVVSQEWREMLAGSEGFLVGKERAGLERHEVVWGEMVGHLCSESRVSDSSFSRTPMLIPQDSMVSRNLSSATLYFASIAETEFLFSWLMPFYLLESC